MTRRACLLALLGVSLAAGAPPAGTEALAGVRARAGAVQHPAPVPILMYHLVGDPRPGTPNVWLWVSPPTFAAQMRALRRAGYRAVTLRHVYDAWTRGIPLPPHPVVISFDDGYRADFARARPVLRRYRWRGVLNLTTANVGPRNITAREVRSLASSGWEIDSHTVHHLDLTTLDTAALRDELVASREQIRKRFGGRADFFCYPYGAYDQRVVDAVTAAGYLAATTTVEGWANPGDLFTLPRIRVNRRDTARSLLARLERERPAL